MPGLIGVVDTRGRAEAERRFASVRDRMLRHGRLHARTASAFDGRGQFGHVSLDRLDDSAQSGPITAVFHGVLHNEADLRRALRDKQPLSSTESLIAALYAEQGASFVSRLEGEFCLIVADSQRGTVLIATDTVGSYPIYLDLDPHGLVAASDLSALLKARSTSTRIDLRAVADYLTLGAILGDRTLAEGVKLLDPGSVLTYDVAANRVAMTSYAQIESFFGPKATDKAAYFDTVGRAFTDAVHRSATAPSGLGLSLSGGLDSRAILSAVPSSVRLRTYTLGVEGCADQVIAQQLSKIVGTDHHYFRLDNTYLRDFLPNMAQMVSITDGMYLSHGLTEMLAIQFLDKTGIRVLLRGHGGELAKAHLAWPLHTDPTVHGMTTVDELVPYLSRRANYVTPDLPLASFFTPEAAQRAGKGTSESFATLLAGKGLSPAESCSYLYMRELHRRFTIPSLQSFRTKVDVRLTYVDPRFLRVLLAAPAAWRDSTEIHTRLTRAGNPALVKVRNSNTGARADAGSREEFVFDKLNTILKRLNVYGYRHYHNFDDWMRRTLLETVQAELLSPEARVQAFVDTRALENLIRETREGKANRSYLLQVLLILELWQRENGVTAAA